MILDWDMVTEESYSHHSTDERDWTTEPDQTILEKQDEECIPRPLFTEPEDWVYILPETYVKELDSISEED